MSSVISGLQERALTKQEWLIESVDGLTLIRSPMLAAHADKLTHAFTTRLGGNSAEFLSSFNLGRHIDDDAARQDAMKNREQLCLTLGVDHSKLTVPGQVHSATVHVVRNDNMPTNLKEVDGGDD